MSALLSPQDLTTLFKLDPPETDRQLSLSSHLLRGELHGVPTALVAEPASWDERALAQARDSVVDAIHWALHASKSRRVQLALPESIPQRLQDPLASLQAVISRSKFKLQLKTWSPSGTLQPLTLTPPSFTQSSARWAQALQQRDKQSLPPLAEELLQQLGSPSWFRWYRNLSGGAWSGRVAGWEVCSLRDGEELIRFGESQSARKQGAPFGVATLSTLAAEVRDFATRRRDPQQRQGQRKREHLLESGVWAGSVELKHQGQTLEPLVSVADPPLQMPARFSPHGSTRYIDALLRDGQTLWVLELKVASGGQGQYYRHGLTQAALYREYLTQAQELHPWLKKQGVDPADIQAAVAFPKLEGRGRAQRLKTLQETAKMMGVSVMELPWSWEQIHQRVF